MTATTHATSGFHCLPDTTLQKWNNRLKSLSKQLGPIDPDAGSYALQDLDDFNVDSDDIESDNDVTVDLPDALLPTLSTLENSLDIEQVRSRLGDNPSASSLTSEVKRTLPLNTKQSMIVERVLSEFLASKDDLYNPAKHKQFLLHVGGEAGVGKSRVSDAIVTGIDLINRRDEAILLAPTGAAADNIGGATYHAALGISLRKTQNPDVPARIKRLWANKAILILDEISMTDLNTLAIIERKCKAAKAQQSSSPDLFGGLPIVIFMGDFFQFPPVRGRPLWKEPRPLNDDDATGKLIWHRFDNVVMLDEQMRQALDPAFRCLLARVRTGSLTLEDLALLNSKIVHSIYDPEWESATIVVN
jgi:PIF1-like helicase